jgi:hypothetical protein
MPAYEETQHNSAPLGDMHKAHNWEYANATARNAATGFVAGDVGKLARQTDDNTLWMLTATTPTWAKQSARVAADLSDFDTQVRANRLDQMAAPTGSVAMNNQKITDLATPATGTDAATKQYVDDNAGVVDVLMQGQGGGGAFNTTTKTALLDNLHEGSNVLAGGRAVNERYTLDAYGYFTTGAANSDITVEFAATNSQESFVGTRAVTLPLNQTDYTAGWHLHVFGQAESLIGDAGGGISTIGMYWFAELQLDGALPVIIAFDDAKAFDKDTTLTLQFSVQWTTASEDNDFTMLNGVMTLDATTV